MSILGNINIDFMSKRKFAMILSVIMVTVSIAAVIVKGLNLGLDFTGGTIVVVKFDSPAEIPKIRSTLQESGYPNVIVKNFGSSKDIEITVPPHKADAVEGGKIDEAEISDNIINILRGVDSSVQLNKVDYIGAQVGDELIEQGSLALLYAIIGILMYVTFRFEWRFSLGAVIALVHDVIITTGVFAITQVQFDLTVLAALLAVIGYSLNDTIVVFDRVRENFRKVRKKTTEEIFNISINQTLSRTIITSSTTLMVLFALFIFGGELIHGFAYALIVGVLIGTYSSIFVASTSALGLGISREDLIPVEKEGANFDHIP